MPPRKPAVEAYSVEPVAVSKAYNELFDEVVKDQQQIEADNGESAQAPEFDTQKAVHRVAERIGRAALNLEISGIITFVSPIEITWRVGHLEHIANLFAGDPQTTERVYADDLAVARAYSAETWERLTNG